MSYLVSLSIREWCKKLQYSRLTIAEAKLKLFDLEAEKERLKSLSGCLVEEWNDHFPRASVPIYLTRVSDKSLTTLRWRRSRTHSNKASQIMLDAKMIEYFHVNHKRTLVYKFESLRIDLNYQLSMILYEIQRLESYVKDAENLAELRINSVVN